MEKLTPALDLLCSAIRESDSETQSKHFSEQLLNLTLSFLNKQIKELFLHNEGKIAAKRGATALSMCQDRDPSGPIARENISQETAIS